MPANDLENSPESTSTPEIEDPAMGTAEVRDTARLHHKTVSEAGKHVKKKPRKKATKTKKYSVAVDPRVWEVAKKLAKGNNRRIQVVNSEEVIVHNHPRK